MKSKNIAVSINFESLEDFLKHCEWDVIIHMNIGGINMELTKEQLAKMARKLIQAKL